MSRCALRCGSLPRVAHSTAQQGTGCRTSLSDGFFSPALQSTGAQSLPLYLTRATVRTNDLDTLVHIGDLSPRQHRTARSSCQEVSTTSIHRPLTLDQRHAEFPMCTSQEGTFSHRWPAGGSHPAESVQYFFSPAFREDKKKLFTAPPRSQNCHSWREKEMPTQHPFGLLCSFSRCHFAAPRSRDRAAGFMGCGTVCARSSRACYSSAAPPLLQA